MKKHLQYLNYVMRHKWFVFWACLQIGGLRLLWRGLIHDWTKFLPSEWFPYVNYFYGKPKTSADGSVGYNHQLNQDDTAFNVAWNHHQKRNDHHWQYWVLNFDDGGAVTLPMSDICRREMLADWRGAGRAQGRPKTWEWYEVNKQKMQLHPETRVWIETEIARLKRFYEQEEKLRGMGIIA